MTPKRYRFPRAGPSLAVLLASTLYAQKPDSRSPGQPEQATTSLKCPQDHSLLVREPDGTYRCLKRGHRFKDPPKSK